jgi:hypothetical protein
MELVNRKHRRVFALVMSAFFTMSALAPAAAWAEMIVKPGH